MNGITAYKYTEDTISNTRATARVADGDILNWLIFSSSPITPSSLKVVWGLDKFASLVLKTLPTEVSVSLALPPHKARHGNYRLFYIEGKRFGVSKNGSDADFFNLAQYYPRETEPETIEKLQAKANHLFNALEDFGIDRPRSLASPHACFRDHELMKALDGAIPSITDLPDEWTDAQEVALQCTPREWTSNYQIGHFPRLWKHDIASAFPSQAIQLPDLRDCSIEEAGEQELLHAKAGFAVGDFIVYPDTPYAFCSPFLVDNEDGLPINFVGTARDYPCSVEDISTLYAFGMGEFKLKRGWAINWDKANYPLANTMNLLFELRGEDELKSYLLKRVMNGVIGKMLETRKDGDGNIVDFGDSYNPLSHAMITNPVRLRVFRAIANSKIAKQELVHIVVDGFHSTRRLPFPETAKIGEWRCSGSEPAFVLSPGFLASPERRVKGNSYDDLLEECASNPTAHLIGRDPNDPIDLNTLFLRQNRRFDSLPETAEDLLLKEYQSEPIRI